jgi:hypothetical protein
MIGSAARDGDPEPSRPGGHQEDTRDTEALAVIAALHREHARWAVWRPQSASGRWTAVRPAGSRPPGPEVPLLWVSATTAAGLGERMREADATLKPGG